MLNEIRPSNSKTALSVPNAKVSCPAILACFGCVRRALKLILLARMMLCQGTTPRALPG